MSYSTLYLKARDQRKKVGQKYQRRAAKLERYFGTLIVAQKHNKLRANPATPAPSYICETWRCMAQTCLNIDSLS